MAKFDFKNVQVIKTGATIKGVDFGLTVPDTIKDELKKFNSVKSFEVSGALELNDYKPVYDPKEWAKNNGLEVTDDGIYCYKAVYQLTAGAATRYFAPRNLLKATRPGDYYYPRGTVRPTGIFRQVIGTNDIFFNVDDPFEYTLNEEVKCGYFETDPEKECAPGLYGSTKEFAESYIYPWVDKVAILKLFVPFEDNQILVPYCCYSIFKMPSDKFRFKKCIPVSAVYKKPTQKPSKSELYSNWDYAIINAIMEALDDPRLVLQVFSEADHNKYVDSVVDMIFDDMAKQEE